MTLEHNISHVPVFQEVSVKRVPESVPTLTENPCPAQDDDDELELEDDYDELSDEEDDSYDDDDDDDEDDECNVIVDHMQNKVVCLSGREQIESGAVAGARSNLEWDHDM